MQSRYDVKRKEMRKKNCDNFLFRFNNYAFIEENMYNLSYESSSIISQFICCTRITPFARYYIGN